MPLITNRYYFIILAIMFWFLIRDKKRAFVPIVLTIAAVALSDWVSNTLKHLIERPRPCYISDGVRLLVGCGNSFSMPSNHAANASAIILALSYKSKKWLRLLLILIALLVGFSRIYVGVHYVSDVIAGLLIGLIISESVIKLYEWASRRYQTKPSTTILIISVLVLSLFRIYYITTGVIDLSPDEAHYWEWSRRLDLSYYSKGPMIAYLIALGTAIFGDNVFGIRIMAVIFSALSSILLYKLGKSLSDERTGISAAILMQIVPLYSAYGVLFTIDSPFILFWILSLYLFYRAVEQKSSGAAVNSQISPCPPLPKGEIKGGLSLLVTRHSSPPPQPPLDKGGIKGGVWILLGVSIGFGLLTKYTMAFFYICALLFLITAKQYRSILRTKQPYISLALSLIIFSPVIVWNAARDWVTLKHTAGQANIADQWSIISSQWLKDFSEFLGSQIGIITPILFVMIFYAIFRLLKSYRDPQSSFLFWFSIPIFAFFLLKSFHGKVQANWALPAYAAGFIAFSVVFISRWESIKKWTQWTVIAGVLISLIITAIAHYPALPLKLIPIAIAHYPAILQLLPKIDPTKLDPTSRARGWKELGSEVSMISDEISKTSPFFIFSDKYQVSSELAFYVKGQPVTYCVNLGRRMNQYDLWPGFKGFIHYNAIFVTIGDAQVSDMFAKSFDNCEKKTFTVYHGGTKNRDYSIFKCYNFKGMKQEEITSY
ncbi:MAG: glycosyltransferase family 39 protein [Nitrospirae bacterium]|nr:glycosyltransferase family 39 protein [Nitrospirota bacterium]